jgi:polyferredoxin
MDKETSKNWDKIRIITQILFLGIFVLLFFTKRMQLWIFIFGAGVLVSVFFSRFYCGWVCPIGSLMRVQTWIYKLFHIKRLKTPEFMKSPIFKWLLLIAFIVLMLMTRMIQLKINIILYVVAAGVLVSLVFEEAFWHKYLCPYGTILNITTRKAPLKLQIDESKCISCGLCQKECISNCIITLENKKRRIENKDCIMCHKCQTVCSTRAIAYRK